MTTKLRKYLAISLIGFVSVPLLVMLGSFIPRQWRSSAQASCQYKVCAIQFDIHTNIIVPVSTDSFDWRKHLALPIDRNQYLGFGWGDRDWYMNPPTQRDEALRRGVKALFFSNASVLGVQAYDRLPTENIKCVGVDRAEYLELMQFLQNSFQHNAQGEVIQLSNNSPLKTNYFEAIGRYSIFRNSNHWTAEGLRAADVNTPLWAGFSFAVMRQIKPSC